MTQQTEAKLLEALDDMLFIAEGLNQGNGSDEMFDKWDQAKAVAADNKGQIAEPFILNGDGWAPDEELSKADAAQAIVDFLWNELEAEKITVTHKGEGCGIHLTVELTEAVMYRAARRQEVTP